jgi:hypothetical protein
MIVEIMNSLYISGVVVRSNMKEERIRINWPSLTVLELCFGFDMEVTMFFCLYCLQFKMFFLAIKGMPFLKIKCYFI